jgi:hypothetical protein
MLSRWASSTGRLEGSKFLLLQVKAVQELIGLLDTEERSTPALRNVENVSTNNSASICRRHQTASTLPARMSKRPDGEGNGKGPLEQATGAQTGSRGIALLLL